MWMNEKVIFDYLECAPEHHKQSSAESVWSQARHYVSLHVSCASVAIVHHHAGMSSHRCLKIYIAFVDACFHCRA